MTLRACGEILIKSFLQLMKFKIHSISKKSNDWEAKGIASLLKKMPHHEVTFNNIRATSKNISQSYSIEKESNLLMGALENKNTSILWDLEGKQVSSEQFSKIIQDLSLESKQIEFIIGGSNGVSNYVFDEVKYVLSASRFTFPHKLFKLILTEQIYRACQIIGGHPYHK